MYFRLDVSFPLNVETMIEDTNKVCEIIGRQLDDAGSGFGDRDVGWVFDADEEDEANEACEKLKSAGYDNARVSQHDD